MARCRALANLYMGCMVCDTSGLVVTHAVRGIRRIGSFLWDSVEVIDCWNMGQPGMLTNSLRTQDEQRSQRIQIWEALWDDRESKIHGSGKGAG